MREPTFLAVLVPSIKTVTSLVTDNLSKYDRILEV